MELAELRGLFLFDGLTDDQLQELIRLGEEVTFAEGDVLFVEAEPAESWWVLLDGRIDLIRRMEHEASVVGSLSRPGVWAGGFLAWAETAGYMATGRAGTPGRALRVPSVALGQVARQWFPFGVHLIEGFFQTVRNMEAMSRRARRVDRAGHAGRRPCPRDQQPRRVGCPRRRRVARDL